MRANPNPMEDHMCMTIEDQLNQAGFTLGSDAVWIDQNPDGPPVKLTAPSVNIPIPVIAPGGRKVVLLIEAS